MIRICSNTDITDTLNPGGEVQLSGNKFNCNVRPTGFYKLGWVYMVKEGGTPRLMYNNLRDVDTGEPISPISAPAPDGEFSREGEWQAGAVANSIQIKPTTEFSVGGGVGKAYESAIFIKEAVDETTAINAYDAAVDAIEKREADGRLDASAKYYVIRDAKLAQDFFVCVESSFEGEFGGRVKLKTDFEKASGSPSVEGYAAEYVDAISASKCSRREDTKTIETITSSSTNTSATTPSSGGDESGGQAEDASAPPPTVISGARKKFYRVHQRFSEPLRVCLSTDEIPVSVEYPDDRSDERVLSIGPARPATPEELSGFGGRSD